METMADKLITHDPYALSLFMTETIFAVGEAPGPAPSAEEAGVAPPLPALGSNARHFVFVVNEPAFPFMVPAELESLKKMLAASSMSMDDVAVVNIAGADLSDGQLQRLFQPAYLVLLGVQPQQAGLPEVPVNEPTGWQGIQLLYTYSFGEIMERTEKKRLFWECFKTLMNNASR